MTLAFVADVHVANHKRWGGPTEGGLNRRGLDCVATIESAALKAAELRASAFIVLGDLFDHTRPSPPLVAATTQAIRKFSGEQWVLLGNHDRQSMHDRDHACASMAQCGIRVAASPTVANFSDAEVALVPYGHGEAKDWLTTALAQLVPHWSGNTGKRRILATHLGIWDEETPAYLKAAKDAVSVGFMRWICNAHKIDAVFAGNWHSHAVWGPPVGGPPPLIVIPGTVCPASFSDPQVPGSMIMHQPGSHSLSRIFIMASPLFLKPDGLEEFKQFVYEGTLLRHHSQLSTGRVYVRATVRGDELPEALDFRDRLLGQCPGAMVHVEVREDEAAVSVREAARAAIASARDDLSETYADLAKVEEPGTRDGVARRLAEYRKVAG